jgi:Alginate lyase
MFNIKSNYIISMTTPSKILNLKNWYLTLPTGKDEPELIYQPKLDTYEHDKHFTVKDNHVVFNAHAGGTTTKNTKNPRSELREMKGKEKAKWSTTVGQHEMIFTEKVVALPKGRPSVVIGQIHRGSDDLIEVRCWIPPKSLTTIIDVFHDSKNYGVLESNYILGTEFTVKIYAADGVINVYYNDMTKPKIKIPAKVSTCFFKAGCYTQANLTISGVKAEDFGEVHMSALDVTHKS